MIYTKNTNRKKRWTSWSLVDHDDQHTKSTKRREYEHHDHLLTKMINTWVAPRTQIKERMSIIITSWVGLRWSTHELHQHYQKKRGWTSWSPFDHDDQHTIFTRSTKRRNDEHHNPYWLGPRWSTHKLHQHHHEKKGWTSQSLTN